MGDGSLDAVYKSCFQSSLCSTDRLFLHSKGTDYPRGDWGKKGCKNREIKTDTSP